MVALLLTGTAVPTLDLTSIPTSYPTPEPTESFVVFDWGPDYRRNYEILYEVQRDSTNYEVHHILPQMFREILLEQTNGLINVHDPRWLREVLVQEPSTGVRIHLRLYTEVWGEWQQNNPSPSAREIVDFARLLEEQYLLEDTLFYRTGPNLPTLVDWQILYDLLLQSGN
jgi:hypothetical protein